MPRERGNSSARVARVSDPDTRVEDPRHTGMEEGMTRTRRALAELLALGLANGLLLGGALATAHRGHALVVAVGTGTFVTLTYLLTTRWRQF